jgi:hypothetical protein
MRVFGFGHLLCTFTVLFIFFAAALGLSVLGHVLDAE